MIKKILLLGLATLSFAGAARADEASDKAAIIKGLNDGCAAFLRHDPDAAISFYLPSVTVFDVAPPRQKTYAMVNAFNKQLLTMLVGKATCVYTDINPVILTPEYAYSTSFVRSTGEIKGGGHYDFTERSTDIYKKVDGKWRVMHEHNSVPVNVITGKADLLSTP